MSPIAYFGTMVDDIQTYLLILLCAAPVHLWLARKLAVNIFDPLFLIILADWFGFTLVTYMWVSGDIAAEHFCYYLASQAAFYAAMLLISRVNTTKIQPRPFEPQFGLAMWVMLISALVHFIATAAKWKLTGIPLFNVSRLGAFSGSGGLGIIERFEVGAYYICSFSTLLMWIRFRSRAKWTTWLVVFWLLVYITFSGSKAALLGLMQVFFILRLLLSDRSQQTYFGSKSGGKAFAAAGVFSLGVLLVQSQGDIQLALFSLAYRLVNFGDIYIYAYVDNTLKYLQGDNWFIGIFGGILSTFRIIPTDWIYRNMGLQLSEIVFPNLDYLAGPNPRHNVFGYHFFGWWGVLFSAGLGLCIALLQSRLFRRTHRGYFAALWAYLLYFSLSSLGGDLDYSFSTLSSILISSVIILVPAQFLYRASLVPRTPSRHALR
jgi:hypothetical protein